MRKYFITLLFLTVLNFSFAQSEAVATSSQQDDDYVEFKKEVNKAKDRIVVNLSYDRLLNTPSGIKSKGFSRGFDAYFMYDIVLGKSRFSIAPGIGIGTNNYMLKYMITSDSTATTFTEFDDNIKVKKSKLALTYVDIPLELRFRSAPNKKGTSWKLAAGFKAGIKIQDKWKYKGDDFGMGEKFKKYNIDNLNKFRYGVMVRGGYGPLNLYAYYSLSDLFNDKGPKMTPLSIGISINGL